MAKPRKTNFDSIMLSCDQHIQGRTAEYQEDEDILGEYVTSGAKLICDGCVGSLNCTNVTFKIPRESCTGQLEGGRPQANSKHTDVDENFVGDFGVCEQKKVYLTELATLSERIETLEGSKDGWFRSAVIGILRFFGSDVSSNHTEINAEIEEINGRLENPRFEDYQCAIEFYEGAEWQNVAEYPRSVDVSGKVNGDNTIAPALLTGENGSYINCKFGGTIKVIENPQPIVHELVSVDLIETWMNENVPGAEWENISEADIREINEALHRNGITERNGIAHILSQVVIENGYGRLVLEEMHQPQPGDNVVTYFNRRYGPNHNQHNLMGNHLGTDPSNNGSRYRGAGHIQLTWRVNYQAFATFLLIQNDSRLYDQGFRAINPRRPRGRRDDNGNQLEPDHMQSMRNEGIISQNSNLDNTAVIVDEVYSEILVALDELGIANNHDILQITRIVTVGAEHVAQYFPWSSLDWFWEEKIRPVFDANDGEPTSLQVTNAINQGTPSAGRREMLYYALMRVWDDLYGEDEGGCIYCGSIEH